MKYGSQLIKVVIKIKVKLIEVIEAEYTVGSGTENDPYREVVEYYLPDGTKIGIVDPVKLSG